MSDDEPCTKGAIARGCTCWIPAARADAIDPPEPKIDKACPLHGRPSAQEFYEDDKRDEYLLDDPLNADHDPIEFL